MADLADLERRVTKLADELDGGARQRVLKTVEPVMLQAVEGAVRADIGDLSMSGWGIPVVGAVKVSDGRAIATPAPGSGGPATVLQRGRNGRRNGRTKAKRTWTKAEARMAKTVPPAVTRALTREVKGVLGG